MRILLTGARGFIGRAVAQRLLGRGHDVVGATRETATPKHDAFDLVAANLLDPGDVRRLADFARCDALVHLAWITEPGKFWHSPENERWVDASHALIETFLRAGGRRVVVAGTCAEYAWSDVPLSEADSPLDPSTPYGRAKGTLFREMPRLVDGHGATWAWGRIFFPYGPGEQGGKFVPQLVEGLRRGVRVPLTEGRQERDFLFVDDVAEVFARLVERTDFQGAVNAASGIAATLREVGEALARIAGRPDLLGWGDLPRREGDPPRIVADVRRLRDDLEFQQSVTLEEGLRRTWAACRSGTA